MQKKFLKIAPYLVLLIVFIIASSLLMWDIKISKSNTVISTFLMKEKGRSVLQTFESNIIASKIDSKEKFDELLLSYAQQENIEFIALTNVSGRILTANISSLVGETLPINTPFVNKFSEHTYINPDFPFTPAQLHQAKYFIVQMRLFRPRMQEDMPHESVRHGNMHGMGGGRRMMLRNNLEQLGIVQNFCNVTEPLFLVVGFNIKEILQAQLLDDKKSVINFIGFSFLILLSILSFVLLKKYQKSYQLIEESKVYFDGLMRTIPLGILTIDKNNVIVTCNPIGESMLFPESQERSENSKKIIGQNICDYIPSIAFMDFNKPIVNTTVKTVNDMENSLELNSFSIIIDNDRKGIGIILRDLREIQKLQEELNRKDRLASLGQLAAGIAHEIRNPLSSIKGFARIFEENAQEGSEEKMLAQIMNQEISRVDKVIADLLEISKPNSLSVNTVSLKKLVEQAQNALILYTKEQNIQFVNDIQIDELTLDYDRFLQILHNIFLNAIEAMKNGGTITVTAKQENNNAVIAIKDTGHGIPQNKLSQLFTPYYTTKAKGTGLGLVIVQKIIEAHKGTITVESGENTGTTFCIILPLTK